MVLTRSIRRVLRINLWPEATAVEDVAEIGDRGRRLPGLGALGDDDVRVGGAPRVTVGLTALQDRPAGGVNRHWMRPSAEPDGPQHRVDVVAAQQPDLAAGGAMQQGEDADQCLMGMHRWVGGPPSKQRPLLFEGEGPAPKTFGFLPVVAT